MSALRKCEKAYIPIIRNGKMRSVQGHVTAYGVSHGVPIDAHQEGGSLETVRIINELPELQL